MAKRRYTAEEIVTVLRHMPLRNRDCRCTVATADRRCAGLTSFPVSRPAGAASPPRVSRSEPLTLFATASVDVRESILEAFQGGGIDINIDCPLELGSVWAFLSFGGPTWQRKWVP